MKLEIKYKDGSLKQIELDVCTSNIALQNTTEEISAILAKKSNDVFFPEIKIFGWENYLSPGNNNIMLDIYYHIRNHDALNKDYKKYIVETKYLDQDCGLVVNNESYGFEHETPYTIKIPILRSIIISYLDKDKILWVKLDDNIILWYCNLVEKLLCLNKLLSIQKQLPGIAITQDDLFVWVYNIYKYYSILLKYKNIDDIETKLSIDLGIDENSLNKIVEFSETIIAMQSNEEGGDADD